MIRLLPVALYAQFLGAITVRSAICEPPAGDVVMEMNAVRDVNVSCHRCVNVTIVTTSTDDRIATLVTTASRDQNGTTLPLIPVCNSSSDDVVTLEIHAWNLGIARLRLSGACQGAPLMLGWTHVGDQEWERQVRVIRDERLADYIFNVAVATAAIFNCFSMGCATPINCVWRHLQQPSTFLVAFACQFVMMPLTALVLSQALSLGGDVTLGLFTTACLPGGGMSHVIVTALGADIPLSATINFLGAFVITVSTPFWLWLGGWLGGASPWHGGRLLVAELWVLLACVAVLLGAGVRARSPSTAAAILTWLSKPLALFVLLVCLTVGASLNSYVTHVLDVRAGVAAVLLPACGHVAGALAVSRRHDRRITVAVATETAVPHCALALALLRWSLCPPAGDVASAVPVVVLVTCVAPTVVVALSRIARRCMRHHCAARRRAKQHTFCIVSAGLEDVARTSVTVITGRDHPQSNADHPQSTTVDYPCTHTTVCHTNGTMLVREKVTAV